jgi:L-erythrulose 1-phosphate isomerase
VKSHVPTLYLGSCLKMYKNVQETVDFFRILDSLTQDIQGKQFRLFAMAPYPALYRVASELPSRKMWLGAQDVYWEEYGAFTGAVSPSMLEECGVQVVQVGHSERRQLFGETDATVNKKVRATLKHDFATLICVGETAEDKDGGISIERIREQTKIALDGAQGEDFTKIWLAYEPAWAIGEAGIPATPQYASDMHDVLREVLVELSPAAGRKIPLLYGGSVDPTNALEFIAKPEIDGLYIGRSAYDAERYNPLIRRIRSVWLEKPA